MTDKKKKHEDEALTVRLPAKLLEEVREKAHGEDRSVASAVRIALTQWVHASDADRKMLAAWGAKHGGGR